MIRCTPVDMAREILIGSRRFWIVSEPHGSGWQAHVLEVEVADGSDTTKDTGIVTTGETRTLADDRAIGQLQHQLNDDSF